MKGLLGRAVGGSVLLAVLWTVLAATRPSTTFHLAPLLVAVWPAVRIRNRRLAPLLSGTGLLIAISTTIAPSSAGLLQGPSLLPWGGPALESAVFAAVGAVVGLVPALLPGHSRS